MSMESTTKLADFYMKMAEQAEEAGLLAIQSYMIGFADGLRNAAGRKIVEVEFGNGYIEGYDDATQGKDARFIGVKKWD